MTSSKRETPTPTTGAHTPTTGAHRRQRRAPHSSQRPPARYEPHLDGLFTYCLSVLCDHDGAVEALGSVLAIAERQDGRCPAGEEERKTWLYALARWTCLRKLAEQKRGRQAHRQQQKQSGGKTPRGARSENRALPAVTPPPDTAGETGLTNAHAPTPDSAAAAEAHRRELAQLAWPEAAGTTPEQREALELAVRHRLAPRAVAAVLGLEPAVAREILAAAACEVERTRAALAVVETCNCPTVARLTGDHRVLLSAALRRELVRHVDDCPRCRRAAERAGAEGPWPGGALTPAAALPVVEAPRPSACVAMIHAQRNRSGSPRFDRAGFPMAPKDHAARRDRLRARVVTTTVVATVVAAPVIALWSAYRGAPPTGEGHDGASVTATGTDDRRGLDDDPHDRYENAGNASPQPGASFKEGSRTPDVSAEVISAGTGQRGPGRILVTARSSGGTTLITLTASGSAPVAWSARANAPWLRLSRSSGTLAAGESVTIRVVVDHAREPAGAWGARVGLAPSGSAVAISGHGATPSGGPSVPSDPSPSSPGPTDPSPDPTDPTPSPTDPSPDPTDPTPSPTDPSPDPTDPTPSPTDPSPTDPTQPPSPDPSDSSGPADPGTSPSDPAPTG
ncbi:BACON domain-containing protein [Streptomyces yanii]|uniref:BACON domain-containing protein n=1 Tax=Streptomyces yanii TaxID=78510 RepID=UPI003CD0BCF2